MLVLALTIVALPLAWLAARRAQRLQPAVRRAGVAFAISCVVVALALRAGPALAGVLIVAVAALAVWLHRRGPGGDDRGDDGRDPPSGPGPDPDPGDLAKARPQPVDRDAFDRARAEWEHELPKRS